MHPTERRKGERYARLARGGASLLVAGVLLCGGMPLRTRRPVFWTSAADVARGPRAASGAAARQAESPCPVMMPCAGREVALIQEDYYHRRSSKAQVSPFFPPVAGKPAPNVSCGSQRAVLDGAEAHPDNNSSQCKGYLRPTSCCCAAAVNSAAARHVPLDASHAPLDAACAHAFNQECGRGGTAMLLAAAAVVALCGCVVFATQARGRKLALQLQLLERERENYRSEAQFWATISHEIRTPLVCVIGLTDILARQPLPQEVHGHMGAILASGKALDQLLKDVLDYSKINAGKLSIVTRPFKLRETLEQAMQLMCATYDPPRCRGVPCSADVNSLSFGESLSSHGSPAHFSLNIDDSVSPNFLLGDAGRIRQCLANLLSNALKFTDKGEVTVTATCSAIDVDSAWSETGVAGNKRDGGGGDSSTGAVNNLCKDGIDRDPPFTRPPTSAKSFLARAAAVTGEALRWVRGKRLRGTSQTLESPSQQVSHSVRATISVPGRVPASAPPSASLPYLQGVAHRVTLRVTVEDTGVGMRQEQVNRLFQPFEQVHREGERRSVGGTGLGLVICKSLCSAMRGSLSCSSEPGAGSVFEFSCELGLLPASPVQERKRASMSVTDSCSTDTDTNSQASDISEGEDGSGCYDDVSGDTRPIDSDLATGSDPVEISQDSSSLEAEASRTATSSMTAPRKLVSPSRPNFLVQSDLVEVAFDNAMRDASGEPTRSLGCPASSGKPTMSVLVVDDIGVNRLILANLLKSLGVEVKTAASGADAIALCNSEVFSVILLDLVMPGMSGEDVARTIRAGGGAGARAPVIAVTSTQAEGGAEICSAAGMNDLMVKPVMLPELVEHISRWASKSQIAFMHKAYARSVAHLIKERGCRAFSV